MIKCNNARKIFRQVTCSTHHSCSFVVLCVLPGEMGMLLGDSAYPLKHFLLVLIKGPVEGYTDAQLRYNQAHRKQRVVIEQSFGLWKAR